MPWQSQGGGGGPWGGGSSGGGGPWGGRGGGMGGGQRPPDIEEIIRRGQERFKRFIPGGGGVGSGGFGGRGLLVVIAILLIAWGLTGFYRVNTGEQGIVLRFGKWVNQINPALPGLHWHLPFPIETAITPSVTEIRRIEIGYRSAGTRGTSVRDVKEESLMLTGDQNIIDIEFTVLWRIKNAGQFLFNIRDPETTVKAVAESAMREIIGQTDIQPALTEKRQEIATDTKVFIQDILDEYEAGILIQEVNLQDVQPPQPVIDAFDDVQRAQQDQDRLRNEAEAYRNKILPEARGEAQRMIQGAEAYRERLLNEADGEAQRFLSVYTAYLQQPEVTKRRMYLETLQKVLGSTDKVILDESVGGAIPYLPLDQLRSGTSGQRVQTPQPLQ